MASGRDALCTPVLRSEASTIAGLGLVVLTRLPPPYRLRPGDALEAMEGSWGGIEVVAMPAAGTWDLLRTLPTRGVAGGASYDAVIVACARKARVGLILTWNLRDFERVTDDIDLATPASQ